MRIYLLSTIIALLTFSCRSFKTESHYITSGENQKELTYQAFYEKGFKVKAVDYNPSENIYKKETTFNGKGLQESETTYYDTAQTVGLEILYRYNGEILTKVLAINIVNGERVDTTKIDYLNKLDSLGRVIQTTSVIDNDTNIIEYQYTDFDKVSNVLSKVGNRLISYEKFYYNENKQKNKYILKIPDYKLEKQEFYNYSDTLLTQIVLLNNSDTLRIDNYDYNEIGLKTSIETIDYKSGDTSKIIIEYE